MQNVGRRLPLNNQVGLRNPGHDASGDLVQRRYRNHDPGLGFCGEAAEAKKQEN